MIRSLLERLPIRVVKKATLDQTAAAIAARDAKLEELRKRDFLLVDNLVTIEDIIGRCTTIAPDVQAAFRVTKSLNRRMGIGDRSAVVPLREKGAYIPL